VEAEYGSIIVEGRKGTYAHHQKKGKYSPQESPAPCNNTGIRPMDELWSDQRQDVIILVSHLDLDTVGGVLRLMGVELFDSYWSNPEFWRVAEFVDLNGPHMMNTCGASEKTLSQLHAYWAWAQKQERTSRTEVTDVTGMIWETCKILRLILKGNEDLLEEGRKMRGEEEELNRQSFVDCQSGIIIRYSDDFCNHLYCKPDERDVQKAVISLSSKTGAITASLARETAGISCREIVQKLWGPEAGGRDGIAGSPRGKKMTVEDLASAVEEVAIALGHRIGRCLLCGGSLHWIYDEGEAPCRCPGLQRRLGDL
jgi:hypothetical protein